MAVCKTVVKKSNGTSSYTYTKLGLRVFKTRIGPTAYKPEPVPTPLLESYEDKLDGKVKVAPKKPATTWPVVRWLLRWFEHRL